ncbi:alpha/beta fold hydrolase [Mesorhizobium sp. B2-4-1]|uniref:alpha/beta fold hydrolase n=1 Tax=Mesorhizobium sp. BR-1-1-8 TaxID=2876659 RepID=UPI00112D23F6|nr:alpha/beta hydrolase [Mesorhizobium sp. BR-1-1-8]TPL26836.1 alpha/beta fold hydrolase [Mesorhizobium sp. B2-4-8]TPL58114.1 alpha/beta fold hydrolase [Mesorhizobium sp. B2-4-1]
MAKTVSLLGATSQRRFASRRNLRKEHGSLSFQFQFSLKRSSRVWVGGLVAAVALLALNNRAATKQALSVRAKGRTIEVDGVRLRYVEAGSGRDLVLLHGNGSAAEDFQTSGLVDKAAKRYRVIVFDRPGFGGSTRLRGRLWTAAAQADLLQSATQRIGADNPIVLGGHRSPFSGRPGIRTRLVARFSSPAIISPPQGSMPCLPPCRHCQSWEPSFATPSCRLSSG